MNRIKSFLGLAIAIALVVGLSACALKPEEAIVGKWEGGDAFVKDASGKSAKAPDSKSQLLNVYKDGTLTLLVAPLEITCKYSFIDENTVKYKAEGFMGSLAGETIASVSFPGKDEMVWSQAGRTVHYHRVK